MRNTVATRTQPRHHPGRELALRREHLDEAPHIHARADVRRHLIEDLRGVAARLALDEGEHRHLIDVARLHALGRHLERFVEGIPSCSSVTTRLNSRFEGSGASSATTPIAPAGCVRAERRCEDVEVLGKLLEKSFRDLARLGANPEVEAIGVEHREHEPERG